MGNWEKLQQTKDFLNGRFSSPKYAIVLGSGLGGLIDDLKDKELEIPFSEVPNMVAAKVEGHTGRLVVGNLGGVRVMGVQGRLHHYEGHAMEQVVFLVRALGLAGVETFILTNAAGGLNEHLKPLDLLLIEDHLNQMTNPLLGPNESRLGPRFPDLSHAYDLSLRQKMIAAATAANVDLKKGVYLGIHGPTYETPAEVKMYRLWGADVVGMSTVPEVIALRHMGKKVVGLSCVTNLAAGVGMTSHGDVLKSGEQVKEKISALLTHALPLFEE